METKDLQNSIIQKVLHTEDSQLLNYLNQLLNNNDEKETYQLSDFEKSIISESLTDYGAGYVISNEDVISRNEEWLKKYSVFSIQCSVNSSFHKKAPSSI